MAIPGNQVVEIKCTGLECTFAELSIMNDMFDNHAGWKALMKLREVERDAAAATALALRMPEESRIESRAVFHAAQAEIEFPLLVKETLDELVGLSTEN